MKQTHEFTDSQVASYSQNKPRPKLRDWVSCGICGWECRYGTGRLFQDWYGHGNIYACLICKVKAAEIVDHDGATALLVAAALGGDVDRET